MTMGVALINYLLAGEALNVVLERRMNWGDRPQGRITPDMTLGMVDGAPIQADDGYVGISTAFVQCDIRAATWLNANLAADLLIDRMLEAGGGFSHDGYEFQSVVVAGRTDFTDPDAAEKRLNRVRVNLELIWKKEP